MAIAVKFICQNIKLQREQINLPSTFSPLGFSNDAATTSESLFGRVVLEVDDLLGIVGCTVGESFSTI